MQIMVNGTSLYYEVHAATRSQVKPLIFIHGFPLSGKMWDPTVERLRQDYKCIVPDVRGHGRSGPGDDFEMSQFAHDLDALLTEVGEPGKVVVIGMSMGGYIAFEFYRQYSHRCEALVLVDTRADADTSEKAQERLALAEKVLSEGSQLVADGMMPHLFSKSASDRLRSRWEQVMAATPAQGVASSLRAMARRPDSIETCSQITIPTLIVVGEEDAITPPGDSRKMHKLIIGSQLAVVSQAGHMAPIEKPEEFSDLVANFLRGL